MTEKISLDAIDKKIIEMLCNDARRPFLEIAQVCEISGAAVHQRVQRLKRLGILVRSGYVLTPSTLGYTTCAFVGIYLERAGMFNPVLDQLAKISEIVECHYTTGNYSIFIKLYAKNNEHLKMILTEKLQHIPGISRTETLVSLEENFNRHLNID